MNIEQIRAEIPKVMNSRLRDRVQFIKEHEPNYRVTPSGGDGSVTDHVIRVLVDMAYEAGKADAIVIPDNATIAKISNESFDCGFEAGYNNAAKDPKAWYVLDKNGEQVHIKDKTTLPNGTTKTIKALGDGGGCSTNTTWIDLGKCEKFTPDSWEKFAEDLSNQLVNAALGRLSEEEKSPDEIAEAFAERAREMLGDPGC